MSGDPYSVGVCQEILEEIAPLLGLFHSTRAGLRRLDELISSHCQDNLAGNDFRSFCCFGAIGKTVSLEIFNQLVVLPLSHYCVQLEQDSPSGPIAPTCLLPETRDHYLEDFGLTANHNISTVFLELVKNHPRKDEIYLFIPKDGIPLTWSQEIAANGSRNNKYASHDSLPSLAVLRDRIQCTIDRTFEARLSDPSLRFFCKETGAIWQVQSDDALDINAIILLASSEFKDLLQNLLDDTGQTFDALAGVTPTHNYPEVEEVVRSGFRGAKQKGMESKDLHLEDGTLGGTVIAMHNEGFLSAEWLAAYLVDTDQNHFMVDERAKQKNSKERYLRIFSATHDFENPTWMQFGKSKGVYLYMSQRASAAEEGWLKIVSFIVNLLIDDINKRLDVASGGRFQLSQRFFNVGVGGLSDPSTGSFARHQDGFPGLIDPLVKGFSRFDLIVPTSAIQNHFAGTTKIAWYRKGDHSSKGPVAFFIHDFLIQHWQLPGVQLNFEHEVSMTEAQ
jgi:hypothetical protein